ncbi:MAG: chromate transporter, partial [Spirochaetaceae bacterium]|nr:chromate transporter [Spirochaetaceae bacterium]
MKVQFQLFLCFFKLGFIAFGGGYSMIPLVEREIVGRLQLMDQQTFTDIVSISGGLPGAVG